MANSTPLATAGGAPCRGTGLYMFEYTGKKK